MKGGERSFKVLPRWNIFIAVVPAASLAFVLVVSLTMLVFRQWAFFGRLGGVLLIMAIGSGLALRPLLALSHTIVVRDTSVVFRGLRRELTVRRGEAVSIRPAPALGGTFEIRSGAGRATFFSRFTGFHEVVLALKEQNPSMTIEGC